MKRLWGINPDYAVIKKVNVLSIESYKADNVFERAIDIEDMDEIVSKNISECIEGKKNVRRPNIWFLSEEMKDDFNVYLNKYRSGDFKQKNREPKFILMFLKKDNEDTFIHSVIDCKFYHNKIPKSQINKIIMDAAFCGAKECYILTNDKQNYSAEKNIILSSNDKYLIKVQEYIQPEPISKDEFRRKYKEDVEQFCRKNGTSV